jgi:hypothetical protein
LFGVRRTSFICRKRRRHRAADDNDGRTDVIPRPAAGTGKLVARRSTTSHHMATARSAVKVEAAKR